MKKQEFMAMSLETGLKCIEPEFGLVNLNGITKGSFYIEGVKCNTSIHKGTGIKPILHPLSDLTKEIEHGGEKFVPSIVLAEIWVNYGLEKQNTRSMKQTFYEFILIIEPVAYPFYLLKKLIEWHFDIAELIAKGEAIDVNELEINPYK